MSIYRIVDGVFVCMSNPHPSLLRICLCRESRATGESMLSLDLAQRRTTFSPVLSIFSVSWSTAMLLGAHTRIWLLGGDERGREERRTEGRMERVRRR